MVPREAVRRGFAGLCRHGSSYQADHPDQVVGAGDQVAGHLRLVQADIPRAAESASGFQPPKYFLNPLTDSLADGIPRMPRRSAVDRTAPPTRVLAHVRRHLPLTQVGHTRVGVVALVRSQRLWVEPIFAQLIDQLGHRIPFGRAGGLRHLKVDQEPTVVFHERVGGICQAGFFARPLLGQQRFGIRPTLMRRIRALFPMEVHPPIAGRAVAVGPLAGRLVSGSEALEAGRGFDQRAVHGEVLIAQQVQLIGLRDHRIKELAGDVVLEQSLAILGEDGRIEAGLHQTHIQEPPIQQVEVELFTEGALTADRIQTDQQRRLQQSLGWNGWATARRVHLIKDGRQLCQGTLRERLDHPQRMLRRHALIQVHKRQHRCLRLASPTHPDHLSLDNDGSTLSPYLFSRKSQIPPEWAFFRSLLVPKPQSQPPRTA